MAPQTLTKQKIADLIGQATAAREVLFTEAKTLRHRLDVPARIKGSLSEHPSAWMLGTAGVGLLASMVFRRRPAREAKKSRGTSSVLLGLALTAARPLVKSWLTGQLGRWATGFTSTPPISRPDPTSRNIF